MTFELLLKDNMGFTLQTFQ